MATPTPIVISASIVFDGSNSQAMIDFMVQQAPDNLPVRGSVQLEPDPLDPGKPLTMTVELADGTIHTLTADGPALQASALQPVPVVS
jgi:hypothetical protein